MIRGLIILSALYLLPVSGAAENLKPGRQIKISKLECQRLTIHKPDASVAYTPGVDVRGGKVAPADLPQKPFTLDKAQIDLDIPVGLIYPDLQPRQLRRNEINVGRISVDLKTGKTLYNGEPLTQGQQNRVYIFCRNKLKNSSHQKK